VRKWLNQGSIPGLDLLFLLYQDKRKILKQRFFPLLFFRKKVAKSSVQGLRNGTPLLKTDHFGDPSASSWFTDARNLGQHKPSFQFAMLVP
jgi:hypothetical protein